MRPCRRIDWRPCADGALEWVQKIHLAVLPSIPREPEFIASSFDAPFERDRSAPVCRWRSGSGAFLASLTASCRRHVLFHVAWSSHALISGPDDLCHS